MIANTVRIVYKYTQRALTPSTFSNLLHTNISKQPLQQIMHNLYLYDSNINVFDYDYYQHICYNLLSYQKKMTVPQIITVLRLGLKHNLKNQMIWKHLEAQIHNRLYKSINPLFEKQKQQANQVMKKIISSLQKASNNDNFQLLTNQFKEEQAKQLNNVEQQNSKSSDRTNMVQKQQKSGKQVRRKNRQQQINKYVFHLVDLLIWYGCQNIKLLNLLLQTQIHPNIMQSNPYSVLRFAELFVYTCQVNMKTYENNKNKYTARSVKGIYKFQAAYFPQLIKNLNKTITSFTQEDLKYLTEVIRSFPIKKRTHRKQIVQMIANQWKNKGFQIQQPEKQKLQQILGKDEKLIQAFRNGQQKLQSKKQTIKAQKIQQKRQKQEQI